MNELNLQEQKMIEILSVHDDKDNGKLAEKIKWSQLMKFCYAFEEEVSPMNE